MNISESTKHRNTVQRKIILEHLVEMRNHPTIEEVHAEVSVRFPTISKSTVYRNLRILANNGQALRILLPDGLERYDGQTHSHYHFQCSSCEAVYDVEMEYLFDAERAVAQKYNFEIISHDIIFRGFCNSCKEN